MQSKYFLFIFFATTFVSVSWLIVWFVLGTETPHPATEKYIQVVDDGNRSNIQETCLKNGGPEAYNNFMKGISSSLNCNNLYDENEIIELNRSNNNFSEIIKNNCDKSPEIVKCFVNSLEYTKGCYTREAQKSLDLKLNILRELVKFTCQNRGKNLSSFIADGGRECFEEKYKDIVECAHHSFGYNASVFESIESAHPAIHFDERGCKKFLKFEKCAIGILQACKKHTIADFIESCYSAGMQISPCKLYSTSAALSGSFIISASAVSTFLSILLALFLV